MQNTLNQKIKILNIIEILIKFTDDDHPLSAEEICKELRKKDIKSERKAIYRYIDLLSNYGFDINKTIFPKRGYYLASRYFEIPELKLLMDAVSSASFITDKKTNELIRKLKRILSFYQIKEFDNLKYTVNSKANNEEIYYNIDAINRAICKDKKVKFMHYKEIISNNKLIFDDGNVCTISPCNLIWAEDRYYVCGFNIVGTFVKYKIEKIKKVSILNENRDDFGKEISTQSPIKFMNQNKVRSKLICDISVLEQFVEQFGHNVVVKKIGISKFESELDIAIDEANVRWLIKYSDLISVKEPIALKDVIVDKVKKINENYL